MGRKGDGEGEGEGEGWGLAKERDLPPLHNVHNFSHASFHCFTWPAGEMSSVRQNTARGQVIRFYRENIQITHNSALN